MRTSFTLLSFLALAAVGCAANPTDDDAVKAPDDEVVGIGDFAKVASALGLVNGAANATALRAGDCYKALKATPSYPEFEFRAYANGAIFWTKKDSGTNSGDARPILCVDMHQGNAALRSLSGVALDAVFRYDLGKPLGGDKPGVVPFERGTLHFTTLPEAERFDAAKKRPHELDFAKPASISGALDKIALKSVTVSSIYQEQDEVRDFEMKGATAFLVFRYAWRKGEDRGAFSVATDSVGNFKKTLEAFGDGPAYGETWQFEKGDAMYGMYFDEGRNVTAETVSWNRRPATKPTAPPTAPPLAECTREHPYLQDVPEEKQPPPTAFRCTGI